MLAGRRRVQKRYQNSSLSTPIPTPASTGYFSLVFSNTNPPKCTALIGIRRDKLVDVDHLIWSTVQDPEIGGLLRYANTKNINYIKELVGLEPKPVEDTDSVEVEYTISLISLAKKGMMDPVIGRDEEIRHLITILLHRTRNNSILVGKRGVRKTSIMKELARHVIARDVLAILADWRILSLDSGSLSSGFVSRDKLKSEPVRF
jgi:ATP-dependent Clp protease ATP-binding subunit ClpB